MNLEYILLSERSQSQKAKQTEKESLDVPGCGGTAGVDWLQRGTSGLLRVMQLSYMLTVLVIIQLSALVNAYELYTGKKGQILLCVHYSWGGKKTWALESISLGKNFSSTTFFCVTWANYLSFQGLGSLICTWGFNSTYLAGLSQGFGE